MLDLLVDALFPQEHLYSRMSWINRGLPPCLPRTIGIISLELFIYCTRISEFICLTIRIFKYFFILTNFKMSTRKIAIALPPNYHAKLGFANKKNSVQNLKLDIYNSTFDSYEKRVSDLFDLMAADLKRVKEANIDKLVAPVKTARKKVEFDDEESGEEYEEELDDDELALVQQMQTLQQKKLAKTAAPTRKSNMSRPKPT